MSDLNNVNKNAEQLVNSSGGFPAQEIDAPGLTTEMPPPRRITARRPTRAAASWRA